MRTCEADDASGPACIITAGPRAARPAFEWPGARLRPPARPILWPTLSKRPPGVRPLQRERPVAPANLGRNNMRGHHELWSRWPPPARQQPIERPFLATSSTSGIVAGARCQAQAAQWPGSLDPASRPDDGCEAAARGSSPLWFGVDRLRSVPEPGKGGERPLRGETINSRSSSCCWQEAASGRARAHFA